MTPRIAPSAAILALGFCASVVACTVQVRAERDTELGNAYGCGMLAERRATRPDSFLPERPWCARYRKLWEIDRVITEPK